MIAQCRNDNPNAWEELINRYRRLIFTIPRRAGLDEDDSADIFQQVFTLLIQNLYQIKQPAQIQAWLVTTTRRETIRLLKKQKLSTSISSEDEEHSEQMNNIADQTPLADEILLKLESQNQVRNAVESLDAKCRKLLEMLFYGENSPSYSKISQTLNISEGSIGPTRARCLQKALNKLS